MTGSKAQALIVVPRPLSHDRGLRYSAQPRTPLAVVGVGVIVDVRFPPVFLLLVAVRKVRVLHRRMVVEVFVHREQVVNTAELRCIGVVSDVSVFVRVRNQRVRMSFELVPCHA